MQIKDAVYVYRLVGGDRLAWHGRYHTHGPKDYEFHLFLEGQGGFLLNRTRYRIEGNRLFLTRPREFHSILPEALEKPISYYAFLFEPESDKREDREALALIQAGEIQRDQGRIIENRSRFLLEELYIKARSRQVNERKAAEYLLLSLIYEWYGSSEFKDTEPVIVPQKNEYIEIALALMKQKIQKKMNTADLAEQLGISEEYFIRLFRKHLGMTPFQYFTHLKIEASSAYLVESRMSVKSISDYFGFENPFHFSRVFKKCTGLAPQEYRATYTQRDMYTQQDTQVQ
ncbi:MAG: helix-turn-helix domain-containing protein [Termitinemataceae bacterium]